MSQSNYAHSKIYRIKSPNCTGEYIGSTKNSLLRRFQGHVDQHKQWVDGNSNWCSSFDIIQHGDSVIELIEQYPCDSKVELHKREGFHIAESRECVNKLIPGRTYKEWYEANKDILSDKGKIYREAHKEEIAERNKKYRSENIHKIRIQQSIYAEANRSIKHEYDLKRRTEQKDRVNQKQRENYRKRQEAKKLSSVPVDVEASDPNLQPKPVNSKEDSKVSQ